MKKAFLLFLLITSVSVAHATTNDRQLLISSLLNGPSSEVRYSAASTLKSYNSSDVRNALMSAATNPRDHFSPQVQKRAIKSLAENATSSNVYMPLINLYRNSIDLELKGLILKSLYRAAAHRREIGNFLVSKLSSDHPLIIRKSAAWGLLEAAANRTFATSLLRIVTNKNEDASLRIEAIKSLYRSRMVSYVKHNLINVVRDRSDAMEVRVAALRVMDYLRNETRGRNLLHSIILSRSQEPKLQAMAVNLLKRSMEEEDVRWLHLSYDPRTNSRRDPFSE